MTALWIVLGIIGLITGILCVPVGVELRYVEGQAVLRVGAAGILKQIYPAKTAPDPKKAKKKALAAAKKKKRRAEKAAKAREKPKKPLSEQLQTIRALLAALGRSFPRLMRALRVELEARLVVAGPEAAGVAIEYGRVCAVLGPTVPLLYRIFTVRDCRIRVEADFQRDKREISGTLRIAAAPMALLGILALFVWVYLRRRPGPGLWAHLKTRLTSRRPGKAAGNAAN